jgi:hypothetical protein
MVMLAQPPAKPPFDADWVYEKPYNFERAKKLEWDWEFEKAVWYYINLVPENVKLAATRIEGIKNHVGNTTIFINTTFKMFVVYDPEVNYMEGDELITRKDVYDKKRLWADQLIQALAK